MSDALVRIRLPAGSHQLTFAWNAALKSRSGRRGIR
jgi:hypothetical protein